MGNWTLLGVSGNTTPLDQGELFGHNVYVSFRLKYSSSAFGSFKESPSLNWHERFMMKMHHKGEWWEFEKNMFEHKPGSPTFGGWVKRYVLAYDSAAGKYNALVKGSSTLFDKNQRQVRVDALGKNLNTDAEKADAVRSYLKRHGGIMDVKVHDIPGINSRPNEHNERLLIFNCGLIGCGGGFMGEQYLNMNTSQPKGNWTRSFRIGGGHTWSTHGLRKIMTPAGVSTPGSPVLLNGEYR